MFIYCVTFCGDAGILDSDPKWLKHNGIIKALYKLPVLSEGLGRSVPIHFSS